MKCMRCGNTISDGAVFCADCLADMAHYPVKPDTPIFLPPPRVSASPRQRKRANKRKVDLIRRYRRLSKALAFLLAIVLVAFAVTVTILVKRLPDNAEKQTVGQNYTTVTQEGRKGD